MPYFGMTKTTGQVGADRRARPRQPSPRYATLSTKTRPGPQPRSGPNATRLVSNIVTETFLPRRLGPGRMGRIAEASSAGSSGDKKFDRTSRRQSEQARRVGSRLHCPPSVRSRRTTGAGQTRPTPGRHEPNLLVGIRESSRDKVASTGRTSPDRGSSQFGKSRA